MSNPKKQQLSLEFMSELFLDGKQKEKLKRLKRPRGKDATTSTPLQKNSNHQLELPLFMLESALEHNNQTSIDKSQLLATCTQELKLLAKSEADSTSNAKTLLPYWNESCAAISSALLSHTKTDWQDSGSTSINGSVTSMTAQSWFSTSQTYLLKQKWLKTYSPSYTASPVDCTDCENIKLRCKKIQIYPSLELKLLWNKWLAACRYCYNQAIAYQKEQGKIAKLKLRTIIMNSDLPEWVKSTPNHIRQNAIFDAHQAYSKSKNCKFRSCQAPRQTIKFNNSNYSQSKWYPLLTKGLELTTSEPIPNKSQNATQLIKTKTGEWFGVFLEEVTEVPNNTNNIIALDPGVRTFLTGFDGQSFVEIGKSDIGRITRLCQHLDKLMSKLAKAKSSRQRQKMRFAAARLRTKIRNLVDECHKQAANWLSKNYQIILLPKFETSQMTNKTKRKINTKTARNMLTWAHYRFKQILKNKAELSGCQVIETTEEFTSKTCTKCGHVHTKLGGSKVFKCPHCGHQLLRDFNGALGILLKALRDTSTIIKPDGAIVVQCDDISFCTA